MSDIKTIVGEMTLNQQDVMRVLCSSSDTVISTKEWTERAGLSSRQLGATLISLKKLVCGPNLLIVTNGRCKDGWLWSVDLSRTSAALLKKTLEENYYKTLSYRLRMVKKTNKY